MPHFVLANTFLGADFQAGKKKTLNVQRPMEEKANSLALLLWRLSPVGRLALFSSISSKTLSSCRSFLLVER